jgi:hypothetical protein
MKPSFFLGARDATVVDGDERVDGSRARREAGRSPRGKTKWCSVPRAVARVEVRAAGALTRLSAFTSKTYDVCGFKTFRALFRATWSCGDIFY